MPALGLALGLPYSRGASAAFVGPLDDYASGLAAAFSTRRLLASYAASLLRIRESGGNTEADIGFDSNGNLDTTALLAHVGSNSGYVTKVYDQSGSGDDLVQATAAKQPRIVNAGTVVTLNGRPAIEVVSNNSQGMATAAFTAQTGATWSIVGTFYVPSDTSTRLFTAPVVGGQDFLAGGLQALAYAPTNSIRTYENFAWRSQVALTPPDSFGVFTRVNSSGDTLQLHDGTSASTSFTPGARNFDKWLLFGYDATNLEATAGAKFAEVMVWSTDQNANKTALLALESDYFSLS